MRVYDGNQRTAPRRGGPSSRSSCRLVDGLYGFRCVDLEGTSRRELRRRSWQVRTCPTYPMCNSSTTPNAPRGTFPLGLACVVPFPFRTTILRSTLPTGPEPLSQLGALLCPLPDSTLSFHFIPYRVHCVEPRNVPLHRALGRAKMLRRVWAEGGHGCKGSIAPCAGSLTVSERDGSSHAGSDWTTGSNGSPSGPNVTVTIRVPRQTCTYPVPSALT